ncbi:putative 60s ribosome biogenesis protein rrp14 protein [Lasiodiplodia theobromae]|uniref:60s ribosome biogenesis protein rrp14 protein n=1 Tax=Lasiodiplodia theobromae TaxID=45133 RepID=A0A5N5DCU2_9PEZI|nr:Ribosome biogenesis protein rrp14-c [Lasiodiplodia theobromae]KAB2575569.1 Ribosomal RNA-processing protein 14-C [Lasiodiplodia theobromae]KAF4536357.1 Ribosome biogenesis protein rrp14-c [Lasiodiplodia theobromae]KAF9630754.1 putative 60s ribosome biogenesis protein rrp14 protein [Lasiodiplodia theobromae]
MADELEERLQSHAQAFEGLMSLIPAKDYYAPDTSDQWQRKKQTKAQKKAAKRAKLDPANNQSAKDVMDENERKRKRELNGEDDSDDLSDLNAPGREKPREGLKTKDAKKQKLENDDAAEEEDEEARQKREEKQKKIDERRQKKKEKQQEKAQVKKERQAAAAAPNPDAGKMDVETAEEASDAAASGDEEIDKVDVSGLVEDEKDEASWTSATPSPEPESPASSAVPSASSSSSILPPASSDSSKKPKNKAGKIQMPQVDQEVLKARLQARIEALRAARKADGIDGKPARNRQELMEARRRKEEERRQRKKEMRKQAKEDEQRKAAEVELARLRGSGSPGTPDIFSPMEQENNFSFGRITFDDGQQMDSTASNLVDAKKKKGRSDAKTALEAAEKKRQRLAGLDEEKRKEIESKDLWLNAKKRAHGEKVKDDTNLLKKTLKRKEKQKKKSEKEWTERIEGVEKGKEMRQKKREENLRKRREEKGTKPGKKANKLKAGKKKARPGFEGSFRSKTK